MIRHNSHPLGVLIGNSSTAKGLYMEGMYLGWQRNAKIKHPDATGTESGFLSISNANSFSDI